MVTGKKSKTTAKAKSSALGDDPLAWITNDVDDGKIEVKETQPKKTIKKPVKKNQDQKVQTSLDQAKRMKAEKKQDKNIIKESTPKNVTTETNILPEAKINLDSVLVINDAQTMYTRLGALLESKQDITIDASAVEMVDTAILQLFFAFTVKVKSQNREVIWIKPSDEMMSRVTTLNLQAGLGLDGVV